MNFHDRISICHRCPHRQQKCAGACPCTIDGRDISEHAQGGDCPKGYFSGQPLPLPPLPPFDGSALWSELHALPFLPDLSEVPARVQAILAKLPHFGCSCRPDAASYLREHPLDLSSPLALAKDLWRWHNHVNRKIGKPEMPWDTAAEMHGWDKLAECAEEKV